MLSDLLKEIATKCHQIFNKYELRHVSHKATIMEMSNKNNNCDSTSATFYCCTQQKHILQCSFL